MKPATPSLLRAFAFLLLSFSIPFAAERASGAEAITLDLAEYCGTAPALPCALEHQNYVKAGRIRDELYRRGWLIASAESLTAGNFAGIFGKADRASGALGGGIVTYNTSVKNALLEVTEQTDDGVMSAETAAQMVEGLARQFHAANTYQGIRKQKRRFQVFIALTGATTHWNDIRPHVHIAVKIGDAAPLVRFYALDPTLKGQRIERAVNIQKAIAKGLELVARALAASN